MRFPTRVSTDQAGCEIFDFRFDKYVDCVVYLYNIKDIMERQKEGHFEEGPFWQYVCPT